MDRLDSWLIRQRGYRAAVLMWIQLCPSFAMIGFGLWGMYGPTPESGFTLLTVGICAALSAAPVTALVVWIRQARCAQHRDMPTFSWRASVALLLWSGAMLLDTTTEQLASWSDLHRIVDLVSLVLIFVGFAFFIASWFAFRRFTAGRRQNI